MTDFWEFPEYEEWRKIYASSPFDTLFDLIEKLEQASRPTTNGLEVWDFWELQNWVYHFENRLGHVGRGYIFMRFYFKLGIPDDRWRISPGRHKTSVEYFPDFEEKHHQIKGWFDFYSEIVYYNLFATWDTLGHIIDYKFCLDMDQKDVDFKSALKRLAKAEPIVHSKLEEIKDSSVFKKANTIRNSITHNYLPNLPGMVVYKPKNILPGTSFNRSIGLNRYVTSREMIENIDSTLKLLAEAIELLI